MIFNFLKLLQKRNKSTIVDNFKMINQIENKICNNNMYLNNHKKFCMLKLKIE